MITLWVFFSDNILVKKYIMKRYMIRFVGRSKMLVKVPVINREDGLIKWLCVMMRYSS